MKELIKTRFTKPKSTFLKTLWRNRFIAIFAAFLLIGVGQIAQGQEIMHVEEAVSEMLASDDPDIFAEGMHLQHLITDVQPAVYLTNGQIAAYGHGTPKVVFSDTSSLNMLYEGHALFSQAELIRITVNAAAELPANINPSQFQGFDELKYLYVVFSYDACGGESDVCLAGILGTLIQGAGIPILYKLSILN